jgi:hypothetical protein
MSLRAATLLALLGLLGLLAAGQAGATELLVREFRGVGRTNTDSFMVRSPWLVDWASRPPSAVDEDPSHLQVQLYDVNTNRWVGLVVKQDGPGRGTVLIEESGRFQFRVQGQATEWTLRVVQVDEAYAQRLKDGKRDREAEPRRRR